jgi:hypothetical protein
MVAGAGGAPVTGSGYYFNMIVLFTDFGLEGPYVGQVQAILHQQAPVQAPCRRDRFIIADEIRSYRTRVGADLIRDKFPFVISSAVQVKHTLPDTMLAGLCLLDCLARVLLQRVFQVLPGVGRFVCGDVLR